jgi:hypothetical protein
MPSEPGRPIPYLDEIALAFPKVKIVGEYIGYPWTDEMIALAWKYDNVYIDTSAYLPRYYPPRLINFMNSYGQDKVLFGTNFPMLSFRDCMDQALALKMSEDAKTKFLAGNAPGSSTWIDVPFVHRATHQMLRRGGQKGPTGKPTGFSCPGRMPRITPSNVRSAQCGPAGHGLSSHRARSRRLPWSR